MISSKRPIFKRIVILAYILILYTVSCPNYIFAADSFEPNNTFGTATTLPLDLNTTSVASYISTSSDVDYFKVNITHTGLYSATLTNNNTNNYGYGDLPADYDLYIMNSSGNTIASSTNSAFQTERVYFNFSSTGYYYFKIMGYNGSYNSSQQYKLLVAHGDAAMLNEAEKFRDFNTTEFYDRQGTGGTKISKGVAYGYGSKDSLQHYASDILSAKNNASTPFDNWNDYGWPKPGRFDGESSGTSWCGIDCSGFTQRCAQAAGTRYYIARVKPLDQYDGLSGNQVPASGFGTYSNIITDYSTLEVGDIAYWSTHIVMFAKIDTTNRFACKIIEAAGDLLVNGGRYVKESTFSRYQGTTLTIARLKQ